MSKNASRSAAIRLRVRAAFAEQGGRCYWCGRACMAPPETPTHRAPMPDDAATADHIHPRGPGIRRPRQAKGQIVMACHRCNQARGAVWNTLLNVARDRGATVIAGPQ